MINSATGHEPPTADEAGHVVRVVDWRAVPDPPVPLA